MDDQASLQQQVFDVSDDQPPLEWPLPNGPQQVSPQNNNKRKDRPNDRPRGERTVYVSGLPLDVTKQELLSFMAKCGIIKKDTETGEFKIKLYQDEMGRPKGDALVVYYKPESVDLALLILDESEIRPDVKVKVTKVPALPLPRCLDTQPPHHRHHGGGHAVRRPSLSKSQSRSRRLALPIRKRRR